MLAFHPIASAPVAWAQAEIKPAQPDGGSVPFYVRAPSGSGYAPRPHFKESRPAMSNSSRPAVTQRNCR